MTDTPSRREHLAQMVAAYPPDLHFALVTLVDPVVGLDEQEKADLERHLRALSRALKDRDDAESPVGAALARIIGSAASVVSAAAYAARGQGDFFTRAHEAADAARDDVEDDTP